MFRRSATDRVLTGVAGGIGERLGIDPVIVRLGFVVLAFAGGIGVLLYVALALVSRGPDPNASQVNPARTRTPQAVAIALILTGVLVMLRQAGLWFGDGVVWPAAIVVLGSAVIWTRGDEATRARWLARLPTALRDDAPRSRTLIGVLVIALGAWAFFSQNQPLDLFDSAPAAVATVLVGLAVIAGPWIWRLVQQVADERRERIRQEERAEMAAHLHDSVLQTLALIQRTEDPNEMVALARGQERELRTWLYGKSRPGGTGSLSAALDDLAAEIERTHRTRIEIVMVGDCPVDETVGALVHACREAMVNAATHSGARGVSVYVEVEDDQVTAFVRDQGIGFSRERVPADRRGIAESIEGRMERNGGVALVESVPGRGTEVRLRIPRGRA
ncbi:MAG TPA: PspC domain-containing protein [Actinomycetota bacterium]|jgi:signal transduction histidine kinase/phage shock protein PspC (stress-responsive transcriptional regulator)